MDKNVYLPHYLLNGIQPLKNNFPKRSNLLVFDTETESRVTGEPYLLIFYNGTKTVYLRVNKNTILTEFMKYLAQHCWRKQSNILFAHNLQFDLTAILCKKEFTIFKWLKPPIIEVNDKAEYLGTVEVFPQKTCFGQIKLKNKAT